MRPLELTDDELKATPIGSWFAFDVESFPNYFLIGMRCELTGKHVFFEDSADSVIDLSKLNWMLIRFQFFGFNSRGYDLPMIAQALTGKRAPELNSSSRLITSSDRMPYWEVPELIGVTLPRHVRHIDLMEVAPLSKSNGGSLKMRAAQMLYKTIQDLPFSPLEALTKEQACQVLPYNANDLEITSCMRRELRRELEIREHMGKRVGIDLMSQSDAQLGEKVIGNAIKKLTGKYPKRAGKPVTAVKYDIPRIINFQSESLRMILARLVDETFTVSGKIIPAKWMDHPIRIGANAYKIGTGGLHSQEKSVAYLSDADNQLIDRDVASYYPAIVLTQGLFPETCGQEFLTVFKDITEERLRAKEAVKAGYEQFINDAEGLKIAINGSIGKGNSFFSFLYSPKMLLQVTLTGQLALLMLIERLEANGIPVVSANTDGIVMLCPHKRTPLANAIVAGWEAETGFKTEETLYRALYAQDVNNYIAVKAKGGTKGKGAYGNPWLTGGTDRFKKNPSALVCVEAVTAFLEHRVPLAQTIEACQDPARFAFVRKVNGGAAFEAQSIGRVARWYRAKGSQSTILTPKQAKVSESEGSRLMMTLPPEVPADCDRAWYVERADRMLGQLGYRFRRQLGFRF